MDFIKKWKEKGAAKRKAFDALGKDMSKLMKKYKVIQKTEFRNVTTEVFLSNKVKYIATEYLTSFKKDLISLKIKYGKILTADEIFFIVINR